MAANKDIAAISFILGITMIDHFAFFTYFFDELRAAKSFDERFKAYEERIKTLGFDGATYTYIPQLNPKQSFATANTPIFVHTEGYPIEFLQHYSEEGFEKNDFTIRYAKSLQNDDAISLDWREYEDSNRVYTKEKKLIRLIREEYKIKNAITILTMHPSGLSGTSLISSNNDDLFSLLKQENMMTMYRCAQLFHDRTIASLPDQFVKPTLENLTQTEKDLLRHLASGAVLKTISDTTDVTYKYAGNLLGDLRKKFGNVSRDRLMYLTGSLHLLEYR